MAKHKIAPNPNVGSNIAYLMSSHIELSSQPAVAKRTGIAQTTIGRIIRGESNPVAENLRRIASAFGVDVDSLYLPPHEFVRLAEGKGPIGLLSRGMAHSVSHARQTIEVRRLTWEGLMDADLSQPFELEVIDDALSPEIYKGCIARFDASATPRAGRPVLVRDADGNHYLRDYQLDAGGRWQATARARGFATLDSVTDGLVLVAVMRGVDWPA